jgi:hypothetical protein
LSFGVALRAAHETRATARRKARVPVAETP